MLVLVLALDTVYGSHGITTFLEQSGEDRLECKFPYSNAVPVSGAFPTLQGRVASPASQPISIDSRTDRLQHPGKLWLIAMQRTVTYRVYVDGGLGGHVRRFHRVTSPLQAPPPDNP